MAAAGTFCAVRALSHSSIGFSGFSAVFSFKVLNFLDSPASQFLQEDGQAWVQGESNEGIQG